MDPLHEDKEDVLLYDYYGLSRVDICLDTGMLKTKACENDIRLDLFELDRVDYFRCYWEDAPDEYCDKHILVDYCVTGGGVCSEYCQQFAKLGEDVKIEERGLLKLTQAEIVEATVKGCYKGKNGTPGDFTGLNDNINKDKNGKSLGVPYKVCPLHTKEAFEKLQETTKPSVDPSAPTVPDATTPPAG